MAVPYLLDKDHSKAFVSPGSDGKLDFSKCFYVLHLSDGTKRRLLFVDTPEDMHGAWVPQGEGKYPATWEDVRAMQDKLTEYMLALPPMEGSE